MTARDRILDAIRVALPARSSPEVIAAEAAALLPDLDSTRPKLTADTLVEAFIGKAEAIGTTIDRVAEMASVPDAVKQYLDRHELRPSLALEQVPALTALGWGGVETHATIAPDEPVGLGIALWGVAESGSLVVHSGAGTPILLSFLPLHHIAVLRERPICLPISRITPLVLPRWRSPGMPSSSPDQAARPTSKAAMSAVRTARDSCM